jgi:hypothetical protein
MSVSLINGLGCKSPLFRIDALEIKSQIIYFKVFKNMFKFPISKNSTHVDCWRGYLQRDLKLVNTPRGCYFYLSIEMRP